MEESTTRPTAEPITAVIAERVRALREQAGMNQASLAEAMSKLGVPWKRATVVNLEKRASSSRGSGSGGRDAVTVQELLALALVFNVPPVLLLADPSEQDRIGDVPIARDLSGDHRGVLMWLVGVADAPGTRASRSDSELVHAGVTVMEALADMRVRRAAAQPPGLQRPVAGGMFRVMVPTTVHVQTAPGDVEPIDHTVVMDLDVVDDRLVCTRIEVEMPDGGTPVTTEVLRRIPVGRYIREAAATGLLVLEVDRNDRSKAHPFVPPSRDFAEYGMSDEVLREVARLYHWALATGEAPLGLLEREYDIPRAKASRWISTARRRGYVKDAVAAQARYRKQKGFGAICTPPIPQPLIDQVAVGLAPVIRDLIAEAVRVELARKENK